MTDNNPWAGHEHARTPVPAPAGREDEASFEPYDQSQFAPYEGEETVDHLLAPLAVPRAVVDPPSPAPRPAPPVLEPEDTDDWYATMPAPSAPAPSTPAPDAWGTPSPATPRSASPADDDWDRVIQAPEPTKKTREPRPPRPPREPMSRGVLYAIVGGVAAIALIVAGALVLPGLIGGGSTEDPVADPTVDTSVEPTPEDTPDTDTPLSTLSPDPDFALPLDATYKAGTKLSFVASGFDAAGWTPAGEYAVDGFTGYRETASGCTVRWRLGTSDFAEGATDFSASVDALVSAAKIEDHAVSEFGYWTDVASPTPQSKAEVVQTEAYAADGVTIVATRAIVATDQVGIIWTTCDTKSADVQGFTNRVRGMLGLAMVAQ